MKEQSKKYLKYIIISIVALIIIFFIYKFKIIREIIFVLVCSFIMSYTLNPIHRKLVTKFNINKRVAAFLLVIGVLILFLGTFTMIIPSMLSESISLEGIIASLEEVVEILISKVNIPKEEFYSIVNNQFGERINLMISSIADNMFLWIVDFSENIIALAIVPIVAYYFLADAELIENKILLIFSAEKRMLIKNIITDIDKVLGKYIIGQLFLCVIVSIMTAVGLFIIDVKFILLLSVLNGMLNLVPYFGAILGAFPAMIIAIVDEPIKVVYVVIMFVIIQQLEGNVIAPQITANSIKMHPLMVIILLLIGEKIAGLVGMVLIVPIGVIIKIIYEDIDYYLF